MKNDTFSLTWIKFDPKFHGLWEMVCKQIQVSKVYLKIQFFQQDQPLKQGQV